MNFIDIILSILIIIIGAGGMFGSVVRNSRRGQSRFVSFVISVLFVIGGILCLIFGLPVSDIFWSWQREKWNSENFGNRYGLFRHFYFGGSDNRRSPGLVQGDNRKAWRGQPWLVAFVGSILFIVAGVLCLVLGFPIAEYGADDWWKLVYSAVNSAEIKLNKIWKEIIKWQ